MDEFALIRARFQDSRFERDDTLVGIGDDAAVVRIESDEHLVRASRTESPEPPADAQCTAIRTFGKAFVDVACLAAEPRWATLALTLPSLEPDWVADFANTASALCLATRVELIGGDTTRGPTCVTVFALGVRPDGFESVAPGTGRTDRLAVVRTGSAVDAVARLVRAARELTRAGLAVRGEDDPEFARDRLPRLALAIGANRSGVDSIAGRVSAYGLTLVAAT